ncbi:sensor histidine kinase [Sedimentibacter sp. B4]|uniref:ATP-binding protein n=1 Tax=Sedimentibacter sp. B4 TaxID=304766 RepID=UPI000301CE47|nr:sensor histidine kinase [Sedimentibacter sp. B4]
MKLRTQIILFFILILLFSVGSITIFSYYQMEIIFNKQLEEKLFDIAYYAAEDNLVKEALAVNEIIPDSELNDHIEKIRVKTNVDFIVVFNMNRIRFTHPNEKNIGQLFKGGDEKRVLETAEEYASKAEGTLGISVRAFVPVFYEGRQVGAVCVGSTVNENTKSLNNIIRQFYPFILIGFVFGIYLSAILASNIKNEILGLEPKEITLMFKEKDAILENVMEGIITLDEAGNLIQYNKEASRILGLTEEDMGKNTEEIIQGNKAYELIKYGEGMHETEVKIRPGLSILCNSSLLKDDKNQVIGSVINFKDLTEVKKMAEELTGIKKMAWSLRANNHEFMNKLHTISGLIQLEEYDEAIKYISRTAKSRNKITDIITGNIKISSISALLLAKYYKAEEMRVKLEIDKQSSLTKLPELMTEEDLESIIGNLIENSLDAVSVDGTGIISMSLYEKEGKLILELRDNGPGIPENIRHRIYEQRFTTKSGQRGYGMYIVRKIVERLNGAINLTVSGGTSWYIEIPMEGGEKDD